MHTTDTALAKMLQRDLICRNCGHRNISKNLCQKRNEPVFEGTYACEEFEFRPNCFCCIHDAPNSCAKGHVFAGEITMFDLYCEHYEFTLENPLKAAICLCPTECKS